MPRVQVQNQMLRRRPTVNGEELAVFGAVAFTASILSAIAGGGGGFIITPLLIFFGLTPAQAVSTGKVGGLSVALGSMLGMRSNKSKLNRKTLAIILAISLAAGLIAPRIIVSLNPGSYENAIGIILILLSIFILYKKVGHHSIQHSSKHRFFGYVATFFSLLAQGIFSSGLGVLVNFSMMIGLGMSSIDANILKRAVQLVLNTTIVVSLLASGLIQWNILAVIIPINFTGSWVGGKLAVQKGSRFVSLVLAGLAFVSGVVLLV